MTAPPPAPSGGGWDASGQGPTGWSPVAPHGSAPLEPYYAPGWTAPVDTGPPARRRGRRRALLRALAAVGAVALLAVVAVGARTWADSRPLGDPSGEVSAHARQLVVGHCLQTLPADGTVRRTTLVPCDVPHEAEVVGSHVHADGPWPGPVPVRREAEAACEMDTAQRAAGVQPVVWTPTEASWRQGDRASLCLAWLPGSGLRGSFTDGDAPLP